MYDQIIALSEELKRKRNINDYSLPSDLVTTLCEGDENEIARFVLNVVRQRISFDIFEPQPCGTPKAAFDCLKKEDGMQARIYYTLKFISLYSNAASETCEKIIDKLLYR